VLDELTEDPAAFDLAAYERAVQRYGRASLTGDTVLIEKIESLTAAVIAALGGDRFVEDEDLFTDSEDSAWDDAGDTDHAYDSGSGVKLRKSTAEAIAHFLMSQRQILSDAQPLYENYASIPLLRHLLQVDRRVPIDRKRAQIWSIYQQVLNAQMTFERRALAGLLPHETQEFSPEVALDRLKRLAEVQQAIPPEFRTSATQAAPADCWDLRVIVEEYGEAEIVRRLLVFPQTTCHDEVAFIRLIQLAECLFWGAFLHIQKAQWAIRRNQFDAALLRIRQASEFASPLVTVFRAVRTMPPAHFLSFRHATDHASAIQSLSWQLLDAHMYGVLPEKEAILRGIKRVGDNIKRMQQPGFIPLVLAVSALGNAMPELNAATVELDHGLRAWRKFHEKQLAGSSDPPYLPAGALGTGGTSGYQYLAIQKPPRMIPVRSPMRAGSTRSHSAV
jgi:tryptophan 2,3-dioxygenase